MAFFFFLWLSIWSWLESLRVFFYSSCPIILLGHRSLPFEEGTNKIAISLNCGNEFESNLDTSPPPRRELILICHKLPPGSKGKRPIYLQMRKLTEKSLFFSQTADLLTVMQPSTRAPFSGLCFRLLPKCLLAPTVCILKSVFRSASCSFFGPRQCEVDSCH